MNNNYYKKYLIYKNKYLSLKGGTRFTSIPNNGNGNEPRLGNQCMWISIRDYLNYHRGIITTATALKRSIGLGPPTDLIEFDAENKQLYDSLVELTKRLNISLLFIITRTDGSIAPYCLNENGTMNPFRTINGGTGNNVYIASYGRHFELIINSSYYQLERHPNSTIQTGVTYRPKVQIDNIYTSPSNVPENKKDLAKALVDNTELQQNIDYFRQEINKMQNEIKQNELDINNIRISDFLDQEEKQAFINNYNIMINDKRVLIEQFRIKIANLSDEQSELEGIIASLS